MRTGYRIGAALLVALAPWSAQAQQDDLATAEAALRDCLQYVEGPAELRERQADAKAAFERAEAAFRHAITAAPRNANGHAGLGEVLTRCGIPQANMTTIMSVVEASTQSLRTALELDPEHWQARFLLAMNSYHMPEIMGQLPVAVRELETLLAQQAGRNDRPSFALTYMYLGDAYRKLGRANDARIAYATGLKLFPAHEQLKQRAAEAGPPDDAGDALAIRDASSLPAVHALMPLRVEGAQHQLEDARSGTSLRRLDVYTMPGGTGEMLQTLQALPGATRASDGADLYVRGGDPEETPVFVNGGRLAFPGRWESLNGSSMGVLDAIVLSRAYFSAGGFSARYGNALSGVVDVETRGRPTEPSWRIGANTVSAGASVYRPLGMATGAWGTATLTDVTLITRMHGTADTYPDVPRSYQVMAGASHDASAALTFKVVAVAAGDVSARVIDTGGYHGAFRSSGSTQHAALSGRWLRTDGRVGMTANVSGSRRTGSYEFGVLERDREDDAYGGRVDIDIIASGETRVRAGLEATRFGAATTGRVPMTRDLNPGSPTELLDAVAESDVHAGGYVEAEQQLSGGLVGVIGARVDRLPGRDDPALDPRIAVAYTSGDWTLRTGAGFFSQGSWRRTYRLPDAGTPSGSPTRARHIVAGFERGGEPAVRVEAYAKIYDRYATASGGGTAIREGRTVGMDAIVRWQRQSRLNGWITYSVLDSRIELEDSDVVPGRYDVTHTLTGVARLALSAAWELGSTLRYATGKPWTPVVGTAPAAQTGWPDEPVFGVMHSERLPHYLRVDSRLTRYQRIGERLAVLYLEMLDLNGRRNIIGYQYDATFTERKPVESFFARRTFVVGAELGF
jgi:vitamin B12 transporter